MPNLTDLLATMQTQPLAGIAAAMATGAGASNGNERHMSMDADPIQKVGCCLFLALNLEQNAQQKRPRLYA
jgi:hypothetical protein